MALLLLLCACERPFVQPEVPPLWWPKPARTDVQRGSLHRHLYPFPKGDHFSFIDMDGNVVLPAIYRNVGRYSDGLIPVRIDDLYGYINDRGEWVIEPQFDYATTMQDGCAIVYHEGTMFLIDAQGVPVFHGPLRHWGPIIHGSVIVETNDVGTSKYGVFRRDGVLIVDTLFSWIQPLVPFGFKITHDSTSVEVVRYDGRVIVPAGLNEYMWYDASNATLHADRIHEGIFDDRSWDTITLGVPCAPSPNVMNVARDAHEIPDPDLFDDGLLYYRIDSTYYYAKEVGTVVWTDVQRTAPITGPLNVSTQLAFDHTLEESAVPDAWSSTSMEIVIDSTSTAPQGMILVHIRNGTDRVYHMRESMGTPLIWMQAQDRHGVWHEIEVPDFHGEWCGVGYPDYGDSLPPRRQWTFPIYRYQGSFSTTCRVRMVGLIGPTFPAMIHPGQLWRSAIALPRKWNTLYFQ